jgi:hypothetical protein
MGDPEYGDIQISRHLGKGFVVDEAPQQAKMDVDLLASPTAYLWVEGGNINIADQVVYRITGYDPADCTLTLDLATDWRPGQKDDPNAQAQP